MREIRFRGRDLENDNQWRYGSLIQYPQGECVIVVTDSDVKELSYEVDPDTVGQDTEITDRNGKPIHEGDVLEASDGDTYKVLWDEDEACFMCKVETSFSRKGWRSLTYPLAYFMRSPYLTVTVIGNIHDNPELKKI